jgi:hypothetical protein
LDLNVHNHANIIKRLIKMLMVSHGLNPSYLIE